MPPAIRQEFVSQEPKEFKYKIGKSLATSLAGFVFGFAAGVIAVGLVWWAWYISRGNAAQ